MRKSNGCAERVKMAGPVENRLANVERIGTDSGYQPGHEIERLCVKKENYQ